MRQYECATFNTWAPQYWRGVKNGTFLEFGFANYAYVFKYISLWCFSTYKYMCDCFRIFAKATLRRLFRPFMLSQGLALVLFLQIFSPPCLSFYQLHSFWLSIFRDDKFTYKLSMSCYLLPLSNSGKSMAQNLNKYVPNCIISCFNHIATVMWQWKNQD